MTNERKVFLSDLETKKISSRKELEEIMEYLKKDKWIEPYINECAIVCLPENSLSNMELSEEYLDSIGESCSEVILGDNTIPVSNECDTKACRNNLLLVLPNETLMAYPTRYTAFRSICDRAGIKGSTIVNDEQKPLLDVLPMIEKASWLTRGFSLHKQGCKVLLREGKISAMLSSEYEVLPAWDILPDFEEELKKDHPEFDFSNGMLSHEYLLLDFMLNDPVMESGFMFTLLNAGMKDVKSVKAGVRFTTSDVGFSKVSAAPFYDVNGVRIRLGKPVEIRHDKGNTKEEFLKKLQSIGMLFKESEEQVELLGNTDIHYPAGCLQHILMDRKLNSLPKGLVDEMIESLTVNPSQGDTAIGIFLLINDIFEKAVATKQPNPTTYINMSEDIAKLLFLDYSAYDKPYIAKEA